MSLLKEYFYLIFFFQKYIFIYEILKLKNKNIIFKKKRFSFIIKFILNYFFFDLNNFTLFLFY